MTCLKGWSREFCQGIFGLGVKLQSTLMLWDWQSEEVNEGMLTHRKKELGGRPKDDAADTPSIWHSLIDAVSYTHLTLPTKA